MSGEVANEALKQRAIASVRPIKGIRLLHNGMTIGAVRSEKTQASDEAITDLITAGLEKNPQLPPAAQVEVVCEQGVVFLLGVVTQQEGQIATQTAQRVRGVKKVVQLFEYLEAY